MTTKFLFPAFALVAWLGAGCLGAAPAQPGPTGTTSAPVPPVPSASPTVTSSSPVPPASGTPSTTSTPVVVDDAWRTYTNDALDFTFKTPVKGSYAPTWEVTFVRDNDPLIRNGCLIPLGRELTAPELNFPVNGLSFCRTSFAEGAAGSHYLSDYFVTKKGNQYIVLLFTKRLSSASAMDCAFSAEFPYSTSPNACVAFKSNEYGALLYTIVSTFRYLSP